MKTHNLMKQVLKFLAIAMLLIATSCSKTLEGDILSTVPADSRLIFVANVDAIVKNAGCKVVQGKVTLSPELSNLVERMNTKDKIRVKQLIAVASMVNLNRIVIFMGTNEKTVITFELTQPELFNSAMIASAKSTDTQDGYTVYTLDSGSVLVTYGNQGWLADSVETVDKCLADAEQNPATNLGAAYEYLCADVTAACIAYVSEQEIKSVPVFSFMSQEPCGTYICAIANLQDNLIEAELTAVTENGEYPDFAQLVSPIDENMLCYIPDEAQVAVAIGKPTESEEIINYALNEFSSYDTSSLSMLSLLGSALNGGLVFAARPAADARFLFTSPETAWDYLAVANIDAESRSQINSLIGMASFSGSMSIETDEDWGQDYISYDYRRIYFADLDPYFAVSSSPIRDTNSRIASEDVSGCLGYVNIDIPANSPIQEAISSPFGFTTNLWLTDSSIKADLRLNGTNSSILKSLIEYASKR